MNVHGHYYSGAPYTENGNRTTPSLPYRVVFPKCTGVAYWSNAAEGTISSSADHVDHTRKHHCHDDEHSNQWHAPREIVAQPGFRSLNVGMREMRVKWESIKDLTHAMLHVCSLVGLHVL